MSIQVLKRKIRKLLLGYDVPTYYFSHVGEDAILESLFHIKLARKEKGFFIDVGAYHPYKYSNTYFLYLNGWTGINIDPCPGGMDLFQKIRPRDTNLEIGIGLEKGSLIYYLVDEQSPMNSFSKGSLMRNGMYRHVKREIPTSVTTLEDALDTHSSKFDHLDLLNIDVEGMDHQVLCSNNWNNYKPDVIVVELNCEDLDELKENESAKFLSDLGYKIIAKNVISRKVASVFFVLESFKY